MKLTPWVIIFLLVFSSVRSDEGLCPPEQEYVDNVAFSSIIAISQESLENCFFDLKELSQETLNQFQLADVRSVKSKNEVVVQNAITISVQSLLALAQSNNRKFAVISDSLDAASLSQLCDSQAAEIGRIKIIPYGLRGVLAANQKLQYMKNYKGNINELEYLLEYVLPADNLNLILLIKGYEIEFPEYLSLHKVDENKAQQVVDQYLDVKNTLIIFSRQEFSNLAMEHQFKLNPALYAFDQNPREAIRLIVNNRQKRIDRPKISALHECG